MEEGSAIRTASIDYSPRRVWVMVFSGLTKMVRETIAKVATVCYNT